MASRFASWHGAPGTSETASDAVCNLAARLCAEAKGRADRAVRTRCRRGRGDGCARRTRLDGAEGHHPIGVYLQRPRPADCRALLGGDAVRQLARFAWATAQMGLCG